MKGTAKAKENSPAKGKLDQSIIGKQNLDTSSIVPAKGPPSKPLFQTKDQPHNFDFKGTLNVQLKNGNCPYCLRKDINVIDIGCAHSFCSKCCMNLIKITRIKKGMNVEKLESD